MAALAAAADSRAFGQLVQRHQSVVRGFLRRLVKDVSQADDIAQETFLKAYQKMGHYQGQGRMRSWLLSIAYREFLMHQRRNRRWLGLFGSGSRQDTEHDAWDEAPEVSDSQSQTLDDVVADQRAVAQALDALSGPAREAVLLCEVYGFSQTEAADLMSLPVGTLKSHVLRGKQRLRRLLMQDSED